MTRMTVDEYTTLIRSNPDITAPALEPPQGLGKTRAVAGYTWADGGDSQTERIQPKRTASDAPRQYAPSEAQEQAAIMQWAEMMRPTWPVLEWLYHVPNGGYRDPSTARMLAAQGVKAGVPDLCLPAARKGNHGLYIELKRADHSNNASPEQKRWIDYLRSAGYLVAVCYGAEEAIRTITAYLDGDGS